MPMQPGQGASRSTMPSYGDVGPTHASSGGSRLVARVGPEGAIQGDVFGRSMLLLPHCLEREEHHPVEHVNAVGPVHGGRSRDAEI